MAMTAHTTTASARARPKRRRSTKKPRISQAEAARLLALRDRLERHLEEMVAFLDEWDGDADLEPSLGARPPHQQVTQDIWAHGNTDDREWECEDEGAGDEDNEPSLGWPETGTRGQSARNVGSTTDYEEDCEDEGAQCDDEGCCNDDAEPSLGWTLDGNRGNNDDDREWDIADKEPSLGWPESGSGSQPRMNTGSTDDREEDCEDEGAMCEDEGAQCDASYDEACGGLA